MRSAVLVLALIGGSAGFHAAGWPAGTGFPVKRRMHPLMMARWTQQDMKTRVVRLPPRVEEFLADETPRDQVGRMWGAFRACYPSEAEALDAVERNPEVILPYLNSPGNIAGNYRVLVEILGKEATRHVCARNPGVLGNNPKALARSSAEDITRAADLVEFVANIPFGERSCKRGESNPPFTLMRAVLESSSGGYWNLSWAPQETFAWGGPCGPMGVCSMKGDSFVHGLVCVLA